MTTSVLPMRSTFLIGGKWVEPTGGETYELVSPTTERLLGTLIQGSAVDVDLAVLAASAALGGPWSRMSPDERADILSALGHELAADGDELARTICAENGTPLAFSQTLQVPGSVGMLDYYAGLARGFAFEEERPGPGGPAVVRKEPVGVIGAIVPWNAPLLLTVLKVAPALAAGCTVVLKPAPETTLSAFLFAECARRAGLPDGVLNVVAGAAATGEYLVTHPLVDKISFTGSTAAGRRIAGLCGERMCRVTLELGGKSAAIVCDDADFGAAAAVLARAAMTLSGQVCAAQTRVLVPASRHDEFVDAYVERVSGLRVGDPMEPDTVIGPLVSKRQRERVEGYIAEGRKAGAKAVLGGGRPVGLATGWYVEPTVFVGVDNRMTIAREEIFGPVACVIPYADTDEAVRIANDSPYGLSGSVYSEDRDRALDIARRVRTGGMTINGFRTSPTAPFGGFKGSGIGREMGPEGLTSCLEYKTILT
jgi:betaine-aldehyde dehydrogenase